MSRKHSTGYRWLPLVLLCAPQLQAAPPSEYLVSAQSSGGSGFQTSSKEWMCSSDYADIQGYADRPDQPTIASLTVQWEKPEIDALGNLCTIRGQLRLPGADPQLGSLDVGDTGVADDGLAHLRPLTKLKRLGLDGTQVTDAGLPILADLPQLCVLFLRRTNVTDAGLVHLRRLKNLRYVYLGRTQVTDAGVAAFELAMPGCVVFQ